MQGGDAESASGSQGDGGALAPRSASSALAESNPFLTGGTGLYDHSARDAVSPSAGRWLGVTGLLLACAVGLVLAMINPAFSGGRAFGTPNQMGEPAAAAAGPELAPGSPAAEGQQLIASKPCVGCHTIPGVPGATSSVGPSLAGVASRTKIAGGAVDNRGPEDLKAWILNPPGKKPGTAMPNVGLTDDEATKIVEYLETLK
ncbi:MAG: cytochrome c [Chloroflexota bacterium]|nr:cytochrome c [Chloroflexota bacterium]